jgi:hypothetical protein
MSRIEMMFSWLKYLSSFISRSVRRQNMEWSKGVIFLMATFWPDGLWSAELSHVNSCLADTDRPNLPNNTVCALSYDILDVVLLRHIEGNLPRATAPRWWHVGGCWSCYALKCEKGGRMS